MITKKSAQNSNDNYLYSKKYPNIENTNAYSETSDTANDTAGVRSSEPAASAKKPDPNPLKKEKAATPNNKKLKKQDTNVLSSYLKDIRKWPIFCKEDEQTFAKAYQEVEYKKGIILERWTKSYSKLINWTPMAT